MRRRHELTDVQWEAIRALLPGKAGDPGRTAADNRLFVNAVLYVLKTGIPWEDLPARYGKPNTAWKRFDRWCGSGVWERIARALGEPDLGEVRVPLPQGALPLSAELAVAGRVHRIELGKVKNHAR